MNKMGIIPKTKASAITSDGKPYHLRYDYVPGRMHPDEFNAIFSTADLLARWAYRRGAQIAFALVALSYRYDQPDQWLRGVLTMDPSQRLPEELEKFLEKYLNTLAIGKVELEQEDE